MSDGVARRTLLRLAMLLYLTVICLDAIRKVANLPVAALSVAYAVTALIYFIAFTRKSAAPAVHCPRYLALFLLLLAVWCVAEAILQHIQAEIALLGLASYVFFVPLIYVGAKIFSNDDDAIKMLKFVAVVGGVIGFGAIVGAFLGASAPVILQPINPTVAYHTFSEGNIYLAPSVFADAEEASEHLVIALFAWLAVEYTPSHKFHDRLGALLGILIIGGIVAAERRTEIYLSIIGVAIFVLLSSAEFSYFARRSMERRRLANTQTLARTVIASMLAVAFISVFLGGGRFISFLGTGSVRNGLNLMFSDPGQQLLTGQGTGTSTQGISIAQAGRLVVATNQGPSAAYDLNGRVFMTAEGGLSKTWLELGTFGLLLYGAVFASSIFPLLRSLTKLDAVGRALVTMVCALGVVFLKGHASLDDPLVQPMFWIAVGGAWGRLGSRLRSLTNAATSSQLGD